jgi:hypothetical protein
MRVGVAPAVAETTAPPIRLRYVLAIAVVAAAVWAAVPRARAAWSLHSAATAFADYALCMVGPTGPSLLRDNPAEFWRLARRRLVTALPDDHPFARCEKTGAELAPGALASRAHAAPAWSFVEYGGYPSARETFRLSDLGVSTRRLAELADRGWPFVRDGYTNLVKPSAYAREAAHPIELPRPGFSRAAPPVRDAVRCAADGAGTGFALALSADRRTKVVRSLAADGVVTEAPFADAAARVIALSCDETSAVVAVGREGSRDVTLAYCVHRGDCTRIPVPRFGASGPPLAYPFDLAYVDGAVVVATPMHGIVRVASTRDHGRTWTPFTVAYDEEAYPALRFDATPPERLFVSGKRLVLYGTAKHAGAAYPVLVSDDAGASFHAP